MNSELALLGELLQMARDPDVTLEEFGDKAESSPHLAAEIVRVANSALYGMEGKINRLDRAVLILGTRTVAAIASSVLIAQQMKSVVIDGLPADALWQHSLRIGACAQLIARCLNMPMESEAYLAGLLHDLGILELYSEHGRPYGELVVRAARQQEPLEPLEQQIFAETHAMRLQRLTEEWGFPELLQMAVLYHHSPEEADDLARPVASLIQAAHIVTREGNNGWTDGAPTDGDGPLLTELGLTEEDIEDILTLLDERIKEISSAIG